MNVGIARLISDLQKLARVQRLTTLTSPPNLKNPIGFGISIWRQTDQTNQGDLMQVSGETWVREDRLKIELLTETEIGMNRLLTFDIENKGEQPYFIYLINITAQGEIKPFFPLSHQNREHGLIAPGVKRVIEDVALLLDRPGHEYVRLIASRKPIDIYLLEQQKYRLRSASRKLNSLEKLLSIKAGWRQAASTEDSGVNIDWCTSQCILSVKH